MLEHRKRKRSCRNNDQPSGGCELDYIMLNIVAGKKMVENVFIFKM
jgi:hypothetical protein